MKKTIFLIIFALTMLSQQAAEKNPPARWSDNPFRTVYRTPFETPPFQLIKEEHYMPAFLRGMTLEKKEVENISSNSAPPTFQNTVEALENSGRLLIKVRQVFYALLDSATSDSLQKIASDVAPLLAKQKDDIFLNERLFARIRKVYDNRDYLILEPEQKKLLENTYRDFVLGGANLLVQQKARLRKINEELSVLTLNFSDHILKDTNAFRLIIDKSEDLAGLPPALAAAAAEKAKEEKLEGKWIFTLQAPSLWPFLQYADNRDLRQKIWQAFVDRCKTSDTDNRKILAKIAALRTEKAHLLGYKTFADYRLEESMAKKPENVYKLLDQLWSPALKRAKAEARELQEMINRDGKDFALAAWDWRYYAEKVRKAKYDLDDEMLRPYFSLDRVRDAAFLLAGKLFGIRFKERTDIPVYHPDVKTFEVIEADGTFIGILYLDYFARLSKRSGAWMDNFRDQHIYRGQKVTPLVFNCCNFTPPTTDQPCLMTFEEVGTLFHEFGHALHGLLSNCRYRKLSGSNVYRDFVELPSQIMENWVTEPEFMKLYAKHYKTGEPIPEEMIERIKKSGLFNQGFATVEFLAASYLDMDWHTIAKVEELDADKFETQSMERIGLIPEIVVRYRSPYFRHSFGGDYAAGYYSYIWAEVLDVDAYTLFKKKGIFDADTGKSYRDNILSRGSTEEPMTLYVRFLGREPDVGPLLKKRGLVSEEEN